ncbi:RNA polymerase sigma-70 factor [Mucilaginibacter sp.]|uniref:RNA polymerase sigma-70 factor n=1 Tax=Mucilaginibacter sp. TaxID=1882438 RepID=UPI002846F981|nr:RNA polymerase sigma-70 factor [Mucilaginibacter sp.]MDR3694847.1 RNA polymerase sigma-70 factor [Mucilaginibacter sp.]
MVPESEIKDLLGEIALNNSRTSFKRLYLLYYNKLFSLAKSLVKFDEAAEEITDDVFLNLWTNRSSLTSINNFTYYCYTAVKNKSLTHLSKPQIKRIELEDVGFEINDTSANAEDLLIAEDLSRIINHSLSKLPEQCRLVFKLLREDGLKYREVAELLDISVKTVEYHMGNALKRLSQDIKNSNKAINTPAPNILFQKK